MSKQQMIVARFICMRPRPGYTWTEYAIYIRYAHGAGRAHFPTTGRMHMYMYDLPISNDYRNFVAEYRLSWYFVSESA